MTPPTPTFEDHLGAVTEATRRMAAHARAAGPAAPVPPCPGWTVLDLLAHQGMVHRWATAVLRGAGLREVDVDALTAEGRAHPDPVAWLEAGSAALVRVLEEAPDDLDAATFLVDAPPARAFWARRQCHETTVHALDALAATLDRPLTADDLWLGPAAALDGVDELLVGFWQRRAFGPRAETPARAVVAATTGQRWLLEYGPERSATRRLRSDDTVADLPTVSGTPVDLHLALWNRGGTVDDPHGLLGAWHDTGAVT